MAVTRKIQPRTRFLHDDARGAVTAAAARVDPRPLRHRRWRRRRGLASTPLPSVSVSRPNSGAPSLARLALSLRPLLARVRAPSAVRTVAASGRATACASRSARGGLCIHVATIGGDHGVWGGGRAGRGARSEDGTREAKAAVPPRRKKAWRPHPIMGEEDRGRRAADETA